jgi:hypothetical protein
VARVVSLGRLRRWLPALLAALTCNALAQPAPTVRIEVRGEHRIIESNGLPDHPHGRFPSVANPNAMLPQRHAFRVPADPRPAPTLTPTGLRPFGVALNGVPLDPGAAELWNDDPRSGWQYEPMSRTRDLGLDRSNAHVQPGGAYHYLGLPLGLMSRWDGKTMLLVGDAADGFPVYAEYGHRDPNNGFSPLEKVRPSYWLKAGARPGGPGGAHDGSFVQDYEYVPRAGSLDECNGRVGVTPEYPAGIYHYYLTEEFSFIPRCWRGTPDESFRQAGPPPGARPATPAEPPKRRPPRRPPSKPQG